MDVDAHVDAVERRVGTRALGDGQARLVTLVRTYDAPADEVWDACTNPDRIARWFLPVSGELRPGGRYQLEGNAGGVVERCDPPRSFAATWEFGGNVSRIEVGVDTGPGGTLLTLGHVVPADEHWDEFGPGAVGIGWELGLLGLAGHLGAAGVPTPDEAAAWSGSPQARLLIARSSDAWCAAHVASGADGMAARAAAGRTTAAYTGEPDRSSLP